MPQKVNEDRIFDYTSRSELLDGTNLALLAELRDDPRLTMAALARRVGMSAPAVTERVRRMEEMGVIRGYRLDIDPTSLGLPVSAYVRVRPNAGQLARVAELADAIPEVVECHRVTGDDCFIMRVYFPSMEQLDQLLDRFLFYGTTTTSIIQSSPVTPRTVPLRTGEQRSME